jgi:H+-transporting ATPase
MATTASNLSPGGTTSIATTARRPADALSQRGPRGGGAAFGGASLLFAAGALHLGLGLEALRSLTFLAIILATQAALYATRTAGPLWRAPPGGWVAISLLLGLGVAIGLAATGTPMAPLPPALILGLLGAAAVFALLLDGLKRALIQRLGFG